jgi:hypothetical protein
MTVPADVQFLVRQRAGFACEYCGISEADIGGELTIDRFRGRQRAVLRTLFGGQEHGTQ